MVQLPKAANTPENSEGLDDFTPVPANKYIAQITKSLYKATKKKDGHYLKLIFKILIGEYIGKTIIENLNLDNPNPIAVEIANKALNSICQATDQIGVEDSDLLHGIPIEINVKVNPASATNPASNSIIGYAPCPEGADIPEDTGETTSQTTEVVTQEEATTGSAPTEEKSLPWDK